MKDLAILLMAGVVLFLVWNSHKTATFMADPTAAIPPVVTQTIIEKFLESRKDLVPIDTVFVNAQPDGSYKARILFFNSKKFLGGGGVVLGIYGFLGKFRKFIKTKPGFKKSIAKFGRKSCIFAIYCKWKSGAKRGFCSVPK